MYAYNSTVLSSCLTGTIEMLWYRTYQLLLNKMYKRLFVCLPACLSACMSMCFSLCICVFGSLHLSLCLTVIPSVCPNSFTNRPITCLVLLKSLGQLVPIIVRGHVCLSHSPLSTAGHFSEKGEISNQWVRFTAKEKCNLCRRRMSVETVAVHAVRSPLFVTRCVAVHAVISPLFVTPSVLRISESPSDPPLVTLSALLLIVTLTKPNCLVLYDIK